jgi:hypothetical protein
LPDKIDPDDDKMIRLTKLFFRGCKIKMAVSS